MEEPMTTQWTAPATVLAVATMLILGAAGTAAAEIEPLEAPTAPNAGDAPAPPPPPSDEPAVEGYQPVEPGDGPVATPSGQRLSVLKARRFAGWTLNRASTSSHAALWFTHFNDQFDEYAHDLHALGEVQLPLDLAVDHTFSVFAMWGGRWQNSGPGPTGIDDLYLGGKLGLGNALGTATLFSASFSLGLPIGEDGVGTDQANGYVGTEDVTINFGASGMFIFAEHIALNAAVDVQFPAGFRREGLINLNSEFVIGTELSDDFETYVRGGFWVSTAWTPLLIYAQLDIVLGPVSLSPRIQIPIGRGDNVGDAGNFMFLGVASVAFD
jgi:hypothetical protein